MILFYKQD